MTNFVCRCCSSTNVKLVLDLGNQPWGNDYIDIERKQKAQRYPLRFCVCKSCMMAQIDSTIPKEIMFVDHTYVSGTTEALRKHFVKVGQSILKRKKLNDTDYILDIGGNDGTFLESFKENGFNVLNIDSGILQSKISNSKNITCINKFFNNKTAEEIVKAKGPAAVIHGSGIFFHLEELHSVFKGVKLLLASNGILVAEFIYLPDMLENCAYDQIYHEHLVYYSLSNLQRFLDQFDLEIFDAELKQIHGGSCVAYIAHKGHNPISDQLKQLKQKELKDGIDKIDTYFEFANKVELNKEKLRDNIRSIKQKGMSIQALGAPVKGSTIINYCKFTSKDIDCGVEINPHKFNTYFPGTDIPVYNQDSTSKPDIYLLLAWNFKDEILSKLVNFRKNGGKVLLPIPEPEII